jgi:hypothetical protein
LNGFHVYALIQSTKNRDVATTLHLHIDILTLVSVAVSAMFKALLCTPKEAAGEKAAAEPMKRVVTASFIVTID